MSSRIGNQIAAEGKEQAMDSTAHPQVGSVVEYHGNVLSCKCKRHGGKKLPKEERHSIDVEIITGDKKEVLYSVPCFVYSQGVISHGFKKDDRVMIQYINGDRTMPVASAYYREPDSLEFFWNSFRDNVSFVFESLLPKKWGD